jgi:hypothetical protein
MGIWHKWITFTITEFPIWERGLTYTHVEMVNHRFHMRIDNFWLPVSTWCSPYGNGD